MTVYNPALNVWLPSAGVFAWLSLLGCSDNKHADPFATPMEREQPAGVAGASAGGKPSSSAGAGGSWGVAGKAGAAAIAGMPGAASGGNAGRGGDHAGSAGRGSENAGAAGASSESPRCSGKPGALRGKSNQSLSAGGLDRSFIYYAPDDLDPNVAAPIVIVPHGWLMSGQQMFDITQYHALADEEGFVVFYPDGEPGALGPWNVGEGACPSNLGLLPLATGDDQAFIDAMITFADNDRCIDRKHVFVSGFSMGGYFSNQVGCLRDDIAAIGPHSGGSHDLEACPTKHKPAIIFHGAMDGLIPASCGKEARDRWVERNGCTTAVETVEVLGGHCEYSQGCPADAQVALCLFDGMDHGWAGGQGSFGFPEYESASTLGWEFFKKYAW